MAAVEEKAISNGQTNVDRDFARVVILSRDETFCADLAGVSCVRVTGPYEATAELLAGPTLAVVIDLRALAPRHARLVEIAQQLGAEAIGCGKMSAALSAAPISGLRLLDTRHVPAEIERLLEQAGGCAELDTPELAADEESQDDPPPEQAAPAANPFARPAAPDPEPSPQRPDPPSLSSSNLLTPQEIAALLGGKP